MKLFLLLPLLALILLPGCAKEREGNGVNIHADLNQAYFEPSNEYRGHHSRSDK